MWRIWRQHQSLLTNAYVPNNEPIYTYRNTTEVSQVTCPGDRLGRQSLGALFQICVAPNTYSISNKPLRIFGGHVFNDMSDPLLVSS